MVQISQLKGWAFVLITSLLLLWLLTRHWKKYVAALREQIKTLQLLQDLANSSSDAIFAKDLGRYLLFNRAACDIVGKRLDEVLGQDDRTFLPARAGALAAGDRAAAAASRRDRRRWKRLSRPPWGARLHRHQGPLRDAHGQIIGTFGISRDITDRKLAEAEIAHLAYHDQLTGPPNRLLLEDRLQQALGWRGALGCGRPAVRRSDHFKRVNDNFGHVAGDARSARWPSAWSPTCARATPWPAWLATSSSSLLPGLAATEAAAAALALGIGEKLRLQIAEPMHLPAGHFEVTASVGVQPLPQGRPGVAGTCCARPTRRCIASRKPGAMPSSCLPTRMHQAAAEHYALEQDLRRALAAGRAAHVLAGQGRCPRRGLGRRGAAALAAPDARLGLARTVHPHRRDSGLIVTVGAWALDQACELIAREAEAGRVLRIAVNVSPRQFLQSDLVGHVRQTLSPPAFDPRCLTLRSPKACCSKARPRCWPAWRSLRRWACASPSTTSARATVARLPGSVCRA